MTPRNVYTWVIELREPFKSPSIDDRSMNPNNEAEWQKHALGAEAKATLDGKYPSATPTNPNLEDPWTIGDDEATDDEGRTSTYSGEWRPESIPVPFRPERSDTSKTKELSKVTEPEWDAATQTWSSAQSTANAQRHDSVEALQKALVYQTEMAHRRSSAKTSTSQAWSLAPSDSPYRPSWLVNRSSHHELQSMTAGDIARMNGNPYETWREHIDMQQAHNHSAPNTAEPQRPPSVYNPYRETLMPGDSISRAFSKSSRPTSDRHLADVLPGERISLPPQIPPTIHTSPRASRDIPPNYSTYSPSRDIEMRPILSVPLDKLSEEYKPEEPQNGRVAWMHALAGFLVVFNCWGITNAYGLFQAYYENYYLPDGTSPASIAWIGSTQLCLVFGLGVPVGRLVDKGYFAVIFHTGTFLMCLGLLCTSWCTTLGTLWATQGLITGGGMGMVFCSGLVALMTWFDETHLSMAMALCAAGSCLGGIVYVLIARSLLITHGFATTLRVLAAVSAGTIVPSNFIFRVRGQRNKCSRRGHRTSRVVPPPSTVGISTPRARPSWRDFTEPAYVLVAFGMFFAFLGVYFGFVYIVLYGNKTLDMSDTAATNLLICMLVANLPGRFLPAFISDKCIGPLNTIIPSLFLSSAVIWLWVASAPSKGGLIVIACFYGFVSAGVQVLFAPTMYGFCIEKRIDGDGGEESVETNKIGVKAGGITTCIGLACLIGTPIGGALISYRQDRGMGNVFLGAQIFAGVCLLLGGLLLLGSRVAKAGCGAKMV